MAASSSEEQPSSPPPATVKECVYKTKLVEFLGRTTPIVLQNDNGPCPLLAICNVLLLRNNLNLSPDMTEVSQEKLLSLVAERLIDSNSNVDDKDEGYVENQQQNIADAIDLLPRLATGIDVNIKFRRMDDFEFTPECAIFDLLDIPLYHGWIVDPQDYETANAIGSKSYNALMEELVALETRNENEYKNSAEEDCVDFAAATTATLGVPSPSLSKSRSFDDSPRFDSGQKARKGDLEEEAELLRALEISQSESPRSLGDPLTADVNNGQELDSSDKTVTKIKPVESVDTLEKEITEHSDLHKTNLTISDDSNGYKPTNNNFTHFDVAPEPEVSLFANPKEGISLDPSTGIEPDGCAPVFDVGGESSVDTSGQIGSLISLSPGRKDGPLDEQRENYSAVLNEIVHRKNALDSTEQSSVSAQNTDLNSDSSSGRIPSEALASTESEPLYEGEDCIAATVDNEVREPVYEGEVVLASQADKSTINSSSKDELTVLGGELIKNFLKSNANQLTINGLFCLQAGLKERELCVFFRNNHFSTMFKFSDELYLLATDQGYIAQSDLVWEKLNEVNGDTLFMNGNFKPFQVENHSNDLWNEHNAMNCTVEYIAKIDSAAQAGMDINPDLQLAIALQQQEMDQQQQRQNTQQQQQQPQPQPQTQPQQSVTGHSRLITGPNVPRTSGRNQQSSSYRPESKTKEKDKCAIM